MKKVILGFIVGAILFGGIGIAVAVQSNIASSDISYTNSKNANVTSVKQAVDDLYNRITSIYAYWNDEFSGSTYSKTSIPSGTNAYTSLAILSVAYSEFSNRPYYIKSTKEQSTVVGHSACLYYNNKEFCILANYGKDMTTTQISAKLKSDMESTLNVTPSCYTTSDSGECKVGNFTCNARQGGASGCGNFSERRSCWINPSGSSACGTW